MGTSSHTLFDQARLFRTLMHPIRIAILEALRNDEACVCHLEAQLQVRQAYLSQQLAVLRKAGLISDRRDGLHIFYRVVRPEVFAVLDAARRLARAEQEALPSPVGCSCPKCVPAEQSRRESILLS